MDQSKWCSMSIIKSDPSVNEIGEVSEFNGGNECMHLYTDLYVFNKCLRSTR